MNKYSQKTDNLYHGYRLYVKPDRDGFKSEFAYAGTSSRLHGGMGDTWDQALHAGEKKIDMMLSDISVADRFLLGR